MKKFLSLLGIILILSSNLVFSAPAKPSSSKVTKTESNSITIFHTSDLNGLLKEDEKNDTIDFSYIGSIKTGMPESLLVDAGNSLQGNLTVEIDEGKKMIELMNLAKYDIIGLGSRDFLYDTERILALSELSASTMLSSNITRRGKTFFDLTTIKEIGEMKIGFFSLISEETKISAKRENISELMFQEIHSTARTCVSELKSQGANIIIALTSIGEKSATDIASLVTGIDLIIDSGNSAPLVEGAKIGKLIKNTLLVSGGSDAKHVGRVDIFLDKDQKITHFNAQMFDKKDMKEITKNKDIDKIVTEIASEADKIYNEEITDSKIQLVNDINTQLKTTPIGNFIADIYREATEADISVIAAGEILTDLKKGVLTRADINSLLKPSNSLQTKKITPKVLRLILEGAVTKSEFTEETKETNDPILDYSKSATTKFLQVSGMKFYYNPNNEVGHKVVKIVLDSGKNLNLNDTKTTLKLAASSYLMNGGEDYTALSGEKNILAQYGNTNTVIVDYFLNRGIVIENTDERAIISDKKEDLTYIWVIASAALACLIAAIIGISALLAKVK